VDDPSSVSISGSKSVWCWLSWAYASWGKHWVLGRWVCEFAYLGGKVTILECWAPAEFPGGAGDGPGRASVCPGCGWLRWSGRRAPVPWRLQRVSAFSPAPLWKEWHPSGWYWQSNARCLSIAALTYLWRGNVTPRFFSFRTSARAFLMRYCISSIAACENPPFAIVAIFKSRHMLDCSSCNRPPYLAIVPDMLKTYQKLVAAAENKISLAPQPYMLP